MNRRVPLPLALLIAFIPQCVAAGDRPDDRVKINGGVDARAGEWPEVAGLLFNGHLPECTGVLIAPKVVLTASYCADAGNPPAYVTLNTVSALAPIEVIEVSDAVAFPNAWETSRIGLIFLREESEVAPRPIAQGCVADYLVDQAPVTAVGWGATDPNGSEYPDALQAVDMPIVDADCSDVDRGCRPDAAPNSEFIAGGNGIDTCYGDGGAPLMLRSPFGDFVAAVSVTGTLDALTGCGYGGIYSRPDAVLPWIEAQTGLSFPPPNCSGVPHEVAMSFLGGNDAIPRLSPRANSTLRIALLSSGSFDATTVIHQKTFLGRGQAPVLDSGRISDVNGDGLDDRVLRFESAAAAITCGDESIAIEGLSRSGDSFRGSAAIATVGCPR